MPLVRACSRPGCAGHSPLDARFCPEHKHLEAVLARQRELARGARPGRQLAKRVYDDVRWRRCREIVLERDAHRCVMCGGTHGLNGHHILGITGTEDDFDPELVVTLCATCHPIAEKQRRRGYGR